MNSNRLGKRAFKPWSKREDNDTWSAGVEVSFNGEVLFRLNIPTLFDNEIDAYTEACIQAAELRG